MRTIAITLGDPAGIGPEVVARALAGDARLPDAKVLVIGSEKVLRTAAERSGLRLEIRRVSAVEQCEEHAVNLWSVAEDMTPAPGHPSPETGRAALAAIDLAMDLAMSRKVDAVATAPVSKRHIAETGVPFIGHTEYLAARAHVKHPVMFFTSRKLRVSLVTTHLAVRKIAMALTADRIVSTLEITGEGLRRYFGVLEPRLAVSGLNPHAGEGGQFGREEIDVIAPAIETAKSRGLRVAGPLPGDTIFRRVLDGAFDAAVCMYHDQALGPVKTLDRAATNVTLGLPYIRTSVDHGTAFDIAGTGKADPAPMAGAIRVACEMTRATAALL
ncbi:MAG: 4-hydroxythreonine-4-phosphate dehydrogenase PdxA [Planctomycetes bacterium]|nr:4-hydroxythreonine-4-phosphate dehydrogenase PdxA [Planctomycetota bacterium]